MPQIEPHPTPHRNLGHCSGCPVWFLDIRVMILRWRGLLHGRDRMWRSHFNHSGAYNIGADGSALRSRCQRWCFAVFGGTGFRAYQALQAESLGCDSLGWSAQRAAPGSVVRKIPPPCKGGTLQACADGGLTGLGYIFGGRSPGPALADSLQPRLSHRGPSALRESELSKTR